jgi:clan AA aspartic protease (TIGR02281 family)
MQKNIIMPFFVIFLFIASVSAWGGTIYKCKDQEGVMVYQKSPCNAAAETVTSWTPKETSEPVIEPEQGKDAEKKPSPVLSLKQNGSRHFTTDGIIDGVAVNFVVDTGASYVSLPEAMAHSAQIYCDKQINMNTANGVADACTAKIKKLQFGPFSLEDVITVISRNLDQPLLGMNVLQMFKVAQENGEMKISILEK